jgi:uncharacterized damage-inducible protein DinB
MFTQTRWIERKFDFNYPVGVFPCFLTRLRGTPDRLEAIASRLKPELLTRAPEHGWTIQENMGHLTDAEALFIGRLEDFQQGLDTLRPANLDGKRTEAADHNARDIKAVLNDFRRVRMGFVKELEALDENTAARSALHPRLNKPMRLIDMVYFMAEHDDFHITRIYELIEELK